MLFTHPFRTHFQWNFSSRHMRKRDWLFQSYFSSSNSGKQFLVLEYIHISSFISLMFEATSILCQKLMPECKRVNKLDFWIVKSTNKVVQQDEKLKDPVA